MGNVFNETSFGCWKSLSQRGNFGVTPCGVDERIVDGRPGDVRRLDGVMLSAIVRGWIENFRQHAGFEPVEVMPWMMFGQVIVDGQMTISSPWARKNRGEYLDAMAWMRFSISSATKLTSYVGDIRYQDPDDKESPQWMAWLHALAGWHLVIDCSADLPIESRGWDEFVLASSTMGQAGLSIAGEPWPTTTGIFAQCGVPAYVLIEKVLHLYAERARRMARGMGAGEWDRYHVAPEALSAQVVLMLPDAASLNPRHFVEKIPDLPELIPDIPAFLAGLLRENPTWRVLVPGDLDGGSFGRLFAAGAEKR